MNGRCHWAYTPDKILELQLSLFPSCHKADSPPWPHGCFMMCRATTGPKHGDQPWPAPKQAIPLPWRLPWGLWHSNSKLTSTIAIVSAQSCSAMDLRDIFKKRKLIYNNVVQPSLPPSLYSLFALFISEFSAHLDNPGSPLPPSPSYKWQGSFLGDSTQSTTLCL